MIKAIKNNIYILKIIHGADRKRIALTLLSVLWHTFVDLVFGALLLRFLINSYENNTPFTTVIFVLLFLLAMQIGYSFFSNYYQNIYVPVSDEKIFQCVQKKIFARSIDISLLDLDNPKYYDDFVKASNEASSRAISCLNNIISIISNLVSLFVLSFVMFRINFIIVLIALIPIFINILLGKKISNTIYQSDMAVIRPQRIMDYLNRVFFLKDYAKEIKVSEIKSVLFKQLNDSIMDIKNIRRKYGKTIVFYRAIVSLISDVACYFGAIIYALILYLVYSSIILGDFVFVITSLNKFTQTIKNNIDSIFSFYNSSKYIDNLLNFIIDKPKSHQNNHRIVFESIDFKNVTFSYDENNIPAINNVSLRIPYGKKIAIVGDNGAGKSTFIKLLLGLYEPNSGEILLNNRPINQFDIKSYKNLFACLFQDFAVFGCSIAENILGRKPINGDEEIIINALNISGLYDDINKNGWSFDSIITKEFDDKGIVLSGGQLQKLAIARALATDAQIIVLDEPTSALDPIAEHNLFSKLKQVYDYKTLIYITHRISSAISADIIYYFENGEIVEYGTHKELIRQNKKYATMYNVQAKQYIETGIEVQS